MKSDSFRFGRFTLDVEGRMLRRDGVVLDVSNRYFDALVLLVRNAGGLVSKDRFMDDVWRGVPVTDEALTQCIRTLRRALDDDAARPRFIETVPKHGYRFVAQVATGEISPEQAAFVNELPKRNWQIFWFTGGAGVIGGGIAGLVGGLFYGFAGGAPPQGAGTGGASIVLVLTALAVLVALIGAGGVSFGIASARLFNPNKWTAMIVGGALGGFVVGGLVKLLGLDAFNIVLGQSPTQITGALEGAVLGSATGLGLWLSKRATFSQSLIYRIWPAAGVGAIAGALITAAGGRLLGGSLHALAELLPQSQLRLDRIGAAFGEVGLGHISQIVTGGFEGMLFAACVSGAILVAERQMAE
ncbi:winged helix-turn-helix domain-containing protein [Sphingorhabdus sp.]|uniref:winged helix-turn-helix domain-containing protein n=1 Tax=Sphingorhabdus sp. TaxID=1902408 RepID=UPI003982F449